MWPPGVIAPSPRGVPAPHRGHARLGGALDTGPGKGAGSAPKSLGQQLDVLTFGPWHTFHGKGKTGRHLDSVFVIIPLLSVLFGLLWAYVLLQKTEKGLESTGLLCFKEQDT